MQDAYVSEAGRHAPDPRKQRRSAEGKYSNEVTAASPRVAADMHACSVCKHGTVARVRPGRHYSTLKGAMRWAPCFVGTISMQLADTARLVHAGCRIE